MSFLYTIFPGKLSTGRRNITTSAVSYKDKVVYSSQSCSGKKYCMGFLSSPSVSIIMIGLLILQQMRDMTDDQAVEQFCFNISLSFFYRAGFRYRLQITTFLPRTVCPHPANEIDLFFHDAIDLLKDEKDTVAGLSSLRMIYSGIAFI